MKDIFSDIYDRVLSFFNTTSTQDETKAVAKNRLRTVLMQDRVGFSERAMQMLKDDLLESISKYLEIDDDAFDLSINASGSATVLNLSIPVLRTKTDEEIDEALSLQEKAKKEKTEEIVGELQELVKEKVQELAKKSETEEETEETKETIEEETTKEEVVEEKDAETVAPLEKRPDTDDEVLDKMLKEDN